MPKIAAIFLIGIVLQIHVYSGPLDTPIRRWLCHPAIHDGKALIMRCTQMTDGFERVSSQPVSGEKDSETIPKAEDEMVLVQVTNQSEVDFSNWERERAQRTEN